MKNKLTLEWLYAALIRAIKTIAQTALGMVTVGAALDDIQWGRVLSVALVAGLISLLTSIATNLPEVGTDGILQIDVNSQSSDTYRLTPQDLDKIRGKTTVRLKVDSKVNIQETAPPQEKPSL